MVENGKIHLICRSCGRGIDYLVSRVTNYLPPKCPSCHGSYIIDQSDRTVESGSSYRKEACS